MQAATMDPLAHARGAARAATMMTLTGGMLGASQIHRQLLGGEAGAQAFARWRRVWASVLLRVFGVRTHVVGAPAEAPRGARLVIANHRSPLDILIALKLIGGTVVSRADLAGWPVLGSAARAADTIFVDRGDARSGLSAIREIRKRLTDGKTVILFPEGATFAGDEVRPFQAGALAAARGLDIEILPVGFAYEPGCEFVDESFGQYTLRMAQRRSIGVGVAIGEPRSLSGPRARAIAGLHDNIEGLVRSARAELGRHADPPGGRV